MSTQSVSIPHAVHSPLAGFARWAALLYGTFCYLCFLTVFLYAMGFVGDWFVPKSIDSGNPEPVRKSLAVNTACLLVFVLQHTIMARPAFKRWTSAFLPGSIERSTFVLAASLALALVFWQWRPLPGIVWSVQSPLGMAALTMLSLLGWGTVLAASFMVSHFDLFGLRQVYLRWKNRPYRPVGFRLVGLYRLVRHPLMLGFLIAFWSTPTMTVGHLFFAGMVTGYIFMGIWFEERDLIAEHGEDYLSYKRRVRGVLPLPR